MMLFLVIMQLVAFPLRDDTILDKAFDSKMLNIEASGSIGQYSATDECIQTYPNHTVGVDDIKRDWCSNIGKDKNDKPWILYSLKGKKMSIKGYSVRNGCCYYGCCCVNGQSIAYCCCDLYSFSLLGSNDNITFKPIHKVEKDSDFYFCKHKTYEFDETEQFRFIKFVLDEQKPGCDFCMAINKIELYGRVSGSFDDFKQDAAVDDDETVSIIGKIKSNE